MDQGGVTSRFKLIDPDSVLAEMKITMRMDRWKTLRDELPKGHWALKAAIDELVASAEKEFYHREAEVPAKGRE